MLNNRTDKKKLLKCLIDCIFILTFIGLIITSRSLAQGPPYNDFSLTPTLSLFDSPYTDYTNSFTSSSFPSINLHKASFSASKIFLPFSNPKSLLTEDSLLPCFYISHKLFPCIIKFSAIFIPFKTVTSKMLGIMFVSN